MLELIYKANAMIDIVSPGTDSVKILEMAINRNDIMRKVWVFMQ